MKKIKLSFLTFLLFAATFLFAPKSGHAIIVSFDALDHPNWGVYNGQQGAGLFTHQGGLSWQLFGFTDVKATFNTDAGTGLFTGTMTHRASNESWKLVMSFTGMYSSIAGLTNEEIFQKLLDPLDTADNRVNFTGGQLELVPLALTPTYTGYTSSMVKSPYIRLNHYINGTYGGSGWFMQGGDVHFILTNPTVIPEPGTFALFGLGLGLAFFIRKRAAGSPSTH